MQEYEIVMLFHPRLSEEQVKAEVEAFKAKTIDGAEITFEDFWGKKRLAYTIDKNESATYVVLHFEFDGQNLGKLEETMTLDKNVIRHLITKVEKDAVKMTLAEITEWNAENLNDIQSGKKDKPVEKRAQLRQRRQPARRPERRPAKELDKKELAKELDAIIEG